MDDPKKILVVIVTRIGDTALVSPILKSISNFYPNSKITVLAHPKRKMILQNLEFINKLKNITKFRARFMGWLSVKKYDLCFAYGHDIELVKYGIRVSKNTIAFSQRSEKVNSKLYKHTKDIEDLNLPQIDRLALLLSLIKIPLISRRIHYKVSKKESDVADEFLIENKLYNKFLIGFQAVSFPTKSFRDWPVENFHTYASKLLETNPNAFFLLFGSNDPKERVKNQWLETMLENNVINLSGLSLRNTAALMSKINFYIGVDTGPSHIMSAFNIPTIVLYSNIFQSNYFGLMQHPLFVPIDHPKKDSKVEEDMGEISVKSVLNKTNKLLKQI